MKAMKRSFRALIVSLPMAGFAAPPPLAPGFGWFGTLPGSCWTGRLPDGTTQHTHCYSTQFDKYVRGTARLESEKEGPRFTIFEGDSVYSWDAASNRMGYVVWGTDGSLRLFHAHYEGEELMFPVPSRADPAKIAVRSAWRRIDADTIVVRRERPQGDKWTTEFSVVYRRTGS